MENCHHTDLFPQETHDLVSQLFSALGEPERVSLAGELEPEENLKSIYSVLILNDFGVHFVFGLLSHFRGNDQGDANIFRFGNRGDLLVVPGFTEDGDILAMCLWFTKGDSLASLLKWPPPAEETTKADHSRLFELLKSHETR